jgi:hypothetical protein
MIFSFVTESVVYFPGKAEAGGVMNDESAAVSTYLS